MVRVTVRLTEYQMERLRDGAKREGVSVSELVRRVVDLVLSDDQEMRRRAVEAVGFIHDVPDLGESHDRYLSEVYAK